MRLLVLTNLYPPQNLGGFGLCIQRLTNGLNALGYQSLVLTSDENYLGSAGTNNSVNRSLKLLGTYQDGLKPLNEGEEKKSRQIANRTILAQTIELFQPNTCLIGNLDLLGIDLLHQIF